ncbi:MAG: DUF2490 domain-containing protein [Gemmatimonadaceae bacterium]
MQDRPPRLALRTSRHTLLALAAFAVSAFAAFDATPLAAQESIRHVVDQPAAWLAFSGANPISDKWRLLSDVQIRQYGAGRQPMQRFFKLGLLRVLTPGVRAGAGYMLAHTSPPEEFVPTVVRFTEHRMFEQFDMNAATGRFAWNHRYRLEQRWLERLGTSGADSATHLGWNYSNRFRYMARVTTSRGGGAPKNGKPYITAYNELFVSFGRIVRYNVFDQNRAFAGVGYQWSPKLRAELGYLNQFVLRGNGTDAERNHTLLLAFSSEAPLYRKKK